MRIFAFSTACLLTAALAAHAQALPPSPAAVDAALVAGGARLGSLQRVDGGWYLLPADTTDANCVGHTDTSAMLSCPNLFGIDGLGLLEAYRHNPSPALLAEAVNAGNALVAIFNAQSPLARTRPYTQDVEFLGALAQTTGNTTYMDVATAWFAVVVADYSSAADRVDALFELRDEQGYRTYAVWDTASLVRAARGVGNVDYATAAAERIVARELDHSEGAVFFPGWKYLNPSDVPSGNNPYGYDFTFLGEGSMLISVVDLPGFTAKRDEYRDYLIGSQEPSGTWDGNDAQITAYVVKGLIGLGDPAAANAIALAEGYFITSQLPAGGWPWYGVEYTEVDSEILQALSALYNTPTGPNVVSQPSPLAGLQFTSVTTVGTTTATAIDPSTTGATPGGFALATLAYDLSTTAMHSGVITSCFWVPTITTQAAFDNVRILHNENGTLVDRTINSGPLAPNFSTKTVCASTTSLSPFAVAVFHKKPPTITAPKKVVAEATGPAGAVVNFGVSAIDPVDGVVPATCSPLASGSTFPLGDTIVNCTAANAAGKTDMASIIVRVRDTVAPDITSVLLSAATLPPIGPALTLTLPPTGQMTTVTLTVAVQDVVDLAPSCSVTKVTSNVKDVDHDGVPDWSIGTVPLTVSLEAATKKNKDRNYKITVKCTDASGNASSEKTIVVVSHLP